MTTSTIDTTSPSDARAGRIQAIRAGAAVRRRLGQAAIHRRRPDGRHEVVLHGKVYRDVALSAAIDAAQEGGPT